MNFKYLDRYLDTFYREKNIPGIGIAVYRYGEKLHTYCTGFADVENKIPFSEETIFNLYSATKISTCTAGMRLVERGVIGLDDPVEKYLPEMGECRVMLPDKTLVPVQNTMRVRHLFSMTAGFAYNSESAELEKLKKEKGGNLRLRQVMEALAQTPLSFEPGTHFQYSFCHDVLGAVLEEAYQDTLGNILKKEVFDPVGMKDTGFSLREDQKKRLAPEYYHFNGKTGRAEKKLYREGVDMGMGALYESGGGGLLSCVRDYALLVAALANGGITPDGNRLLASESIDLMRTNQLTETALEDFGKFGGWSKAGYGYGLGVRTLMDRERNHSLSENGEFGWDGALGCYVLADPKSGIGIFYAQQESGSPWYDWIGMVRNYVYACVMGGGK